MKTLLLLGVLAGLPALVSAQTVWRCGPEGRSFSDTPCAEGQATSLALADTRPADEVRAAQARAAREIRQAEALRRERLAEEAAQRGNGLAALGPVAATTPRTRPTPLRVKPPAGVQPVRAQGLRPADLAARGTSTAIGPSFRRKTD